MDCLSANQIKEFVAYFNQYTIILVIARLNILYGQSVQFLASFLCLSFPVNFLYIARTKAALTGLKAVLTYRSMASVTVFKNGGKK